MKNLLRIEELFLFGLTIVLFSFLDYKWWLFPALLLVPDLGMAGYAINNRIGSLVYNIVHLKATSIALYIVGVVAGVEVIQLIGIIMLAHTSLDRVFDYGLKYADRFQHTHLNADDVKSA